MPEPMLSKVLFAKPNTFVVFDIQKEWSKEFGSENGYPQAGVMIKSSLIENNPELASKIISKIKESNDWVNENPKLAGNYAEKLEIGLDNQTVEKSIAGLNIRFVDAYEAKDDIMSYFSQFNESPDSIGGKLPDDAFYYSD